MTLPKLPSLKGIGISLAKTLLPKSLEYKFGITKKPKAMEFRVGEGLPKWQKKKAERKISRLIKQAPELSIKLPFIQKEVLRPPGVAEETLKYMVELPEKVATSLREVPKILKTGKVPTPTKPYRVSSYAEDTLKRIDELEKEVGLDTKTASVAAILQVGGQAILDVVILSSYLESGARAVAKNYTPALVEKVSAWKLMGKPKTVKELNTTWKSLNKQFHPDLVGENSAIREINGAYSILKKGLPTKTELLKIKMGGLAQKTISPISKIMDLPTPDYALPFKQLPGLAPEKPLQPTFGLSVKKMKPVGMAKPTLPTGKEIIKKPDVLIPAKPSILPPLPMISKPAVKPAIPKELELGLPKITPKEEEAVLRAEFEKAASVIKKETEKSLFKDIKSLGGIKSYKEGFLAEEMSPVPLSLRNNKTGSTLDELAENLKGKGYNFDNDSDLLEAILDIRSEGVRVTKLKTSTIKILKTIEKKMPEKVASVSRRLLSKLHRLKYPKVSAEQKAIRRAVEKGVYAPPRIEPKELSGFKNFIDTTKIKRKDIPYEELGIAEVVRGDKMFPAIRESGFYANKDIQTAPIKDIYDQALSPYHMALRQDGYKLGGKFGTMFKKVWKPTETAIRTEKEFSNHNARTIQRLGKKYKIKASKRNLEHLSDVIEKKVKATPNEEVYIKELRGVLDELRNQSNMVREAMGKSKIGYIENYIPHLQKTALWNELISNKATISDNLDFIIPNQVKNPFSFRRMLELMPKAERNIYILLDRYIRAIAKDIYITPAIENIKAYNGVLKNRDSMNASKYWDEYIRTGLIGKQHKLDTALSIGFKGRKALQKWNNMVNLAFLTGKVAWNIATQPLSYIMNVPMEAGIINAIKAIPKSFGKGLRKYVKENSNVLAIKSGDVRAVAIGEGRNIQNRIYRTKIDKYNDFISMIGSVEERQLTLTSYITGLERAKDLGYTGQDALDFADLTAARTQSMYNKENRALILNSDVTRAVFPFSSFSVEMFNHLKEIITRGGAEALNARQRVGKLFRLLVGLYLANLYSQTVTGRKKTTIGTFFPFVGSSVIDPLVAKIKGEQFYGGRSPITVIQISEDVIKGSQDFIKHGSIRKLRKVGINFGLALGGIGGGGQINNFIDGIMADIDEEVTNVKGDTMFEVKDSLSKVIAPFFGVWATMEGREYFKPKEEKAKPKGLPSLKMEGPGLPKLPKLPKLPSLPSLKGVGSF